MSKKGAGNKRPIEPEQVQGLTDIGDAVIVPADFANSPAATDQSAKRIKLENGGTGMLKVDLSNCLRITPVKSASNSPSTSASPAFNRSPRVAFASPRTVSLIYEHVMLNQSPVINDKFVSSN